VRGAADEGPVRRRERMVGGAHGENVLGGRRMAK
jgi:hypothetical protein